MNFNFNETEKKQEHCFCQSPSLIFIIMHKLSCQALIVPITWTGSNSESVRGQSPKAGNGRSRWTEVDRMLCGQNAWIYKDFPVPGRYSEAHCSSQLSPWPDATL